jgi:hypothetical protein
MIHEFSHVIANGLATLDVDFNKVAHRLDYPTHGKPITGRIALSKEGAKANPYIFVNHFEVAGKKHFSIVAKNHKGDEWIFDSYKETRSDSNYTPIVFKPTPKPKPATEKPLFQRALQSSESATNANVSTHDYAVKKGINGDNCDIRRGGFNFEHDGFSYADCLMAKYFGIDGELRGFQFINAAGDKRYINQFDGGKSGAFIVIGNAEMVQFGAIFVEGLATGLSVYSSVGDGKKTLNNAEGMPVVVCLDVGNMKAVTKAHAAKYGADTINIYADNDYKEGEGNAGRFIAVEIMRSLGLKSYLLPVIDGNDCVKCDFNDTTEFRKYGYGTTKIDYLTALLKYGQKTSLNKLAIRLAYAVADTVPFKNSIDEAVAIVTKAASSRGLDVEAMVRKIITKAVSKRKAELKLNHRLTDLSTTWRIDVDGLDNQQINNIHNFDGVALLDNRGKGSGKTEFMGLRIAKMESCAYVTHRTALIDDACNRLGLSHYKDGDRYADKIGVCINSIQKFAQNMRGMPLFLDEVRQLLETIISSPTIDNRQPLLDCFKDLLGACPSLHLADADLNDFTVEFFKRHAPHLQFNLLETTTSTHDASHYLFGNIDTARHAALIDLQNGKRGMIGCTSENEAQKTFKHLVKSGIDTDRILLIHGDNKGNERQAAFLANVNTEAQKYDVIIYTSVLGSGVSIVVPEFEFTYLLCSNVLATNESMQMLARNRCAKNVYVAFGNQLNMNRVTDLDTLKNGAIEKVRNFAADNGIDADTVLNELGLMQCETQSKLNADLNDFQNNFLLLAEIEGREFTRLSGVLIDGTIQEVKIKGLAKEVKEETIANIHAAPIVDAIEYKSLKRTNATTQQQSYSIKRFEVTEMTGASANQVTIDDVANFVDGDYSRLKNYELIDADTDILKNQDRENFKTRNKSKSLVSRQKIFKAFLKPLLAANDKGIGKADFQKACKVLKKYHAELAGEFGNYNKEVFIRAGETVDYFADKIGYLIEEKTVKNGERFYSIKLKTQVSRYASRRKGCS